MNYRMTNQKQIRKAFWLDHPHLAEQAREAGIISKRQNAHCATVRCAFVDYVDHLQKAGFISEKLSDRATL